MRERHWWSAVPQKLLYVLLGVSLATLVITFWFWGQQWANLPTGSVATPEALKEKLEAYDKRADELEKLLALLLGVSTIYAIALGFSAYQQLKDSTDKLEKLSDKAEKKIEQLPDEIAHIRMDAKDEIQEFVVKVVSKFPLFADMDIAIRTIMDHLMRLLPVIDWRDEDYGKLKDQEKQEILFYEKTVASLECFDLQRNPHIRGTISEIYHGLGNFYGLKYVADGRRQNEDKERARFYLNRAISHDSENSGALNDCGLYALQIEDPPDLKLARKRFNESLGADSDQQRATYNLAWIEQEEGNLSRGEDLLSHALGMTKWQKNLPPRIGSILYNRACARARLGARETDTTKRGEWLSKSLDDLNATFPAGKAPYDAENVATFKQDIQTGGDLSFLASNDPWRAEIRLVVERLPQ